MRFLIKAEELDSGIENQIVWEFLFYDDETRLFDKITEFVNQEELK